LKTRWSKPSRRHSGWRKNQRAEIRRRLALKAHKNDKLSAGRSLQALSNVTRDSRTKELAAQDARFFFRQLGKDK